MVEQYNNYSINNIPVNGIATQVRGDITGTPASHRNNQNHRTVLCPHLFIFLTQLSELDSGQSEQMTFQLDN